MGVFFITVCWLLDLQAVVTSILIGDNFLASHTLLGLSFQLYTRDILLGVIILHVPSHASCDCVSD